MCLITMPSFTSVDFINGGRAAQRQWLKATQLGYAYQPLIAPLYLFPRVLYGNGEGLDDYSIIELNELREEFMKIFRGIKSGEKFFLQGFSKRMKLKSAPYDYL